METKPIDGFDGYFISSCGNVISDKGNRLRVLKQKSIWSGYRQVCLCRDGKKISCSVHRLVAEAFIPNPSSKPQVNHIDGDKRNNCVDNLEWCTSSENNLHSYRKLGRKPSKPMLGIFGGDHPQARSVVQLTMDGRFIDEYETAKKASEVTGARRGHICFCCKGKRKSAGGYRWKYKGEK